MQRAFGHADIQATFEYMVGLGVDLVDLQSVMRAASAADRL